MTTVKIDLPDEQAAALAAKATAQGISAEEYVRQVLEEDLKEGMDQKQDCRHIAEIIADIVKDLPPEEFSKLPEDGASEHDHYLYGHLKRNQ
jgi:plasmid stability protein